MASLEPRSDLGSKAEVGKVKMGGWQFNRRVDAGHLIQAVVMAAGFFYWTMSERATIQAQFSEGMKDRAVMATRIAALEANDQKQQAKDDLFSAEMRASLKELSQKMSDLQTLIAAISSGSKK